MSKQSSSRFLLFIWAILFISPACAGEVVVDLDAAKLSPGRLERWPNAGRLGGYFAPVAGAPIVASIAGRSAVTFTGKADFLKASFSAPAAITGNHPFTLTAWAYDPEIGARKVICSWASFPGQAAEIGIGRGRNAAFFSSAVTRLGFEGGVPASGEWQHIAVTYDQRTLRVYLDGRLNAEKTSSLEIKGGGDVYLGAGWDARRNTAMLPFAGSLARLQIFDSVLSEREIRNQLGEFAAFNPVPRNGEVVEDLRTLFRWESGSAETTAFRVWISNTRTDLEMANPKPLSFIGSISPAAASFGLVDLVPGRTYFWRVDEVAADGKVKWSGEIWSFFASPSPAHNPYPRDKIAGVNADIAELRWTPGKFAVSQDLYFGESYGTVAKAATPQVRNLGRGIRSCRVPLLLHYGETYYWRVDTNNGPLPRAKGDIWSFRVEDQHIFDDVTFFLTSDVHYGASVSVAAAAQATIDQMNSLPGTSYPESLGGTVRTPRGVIVLGDLVDDGNAEDASEVWRTYCADFGVKGEGRLAYAVYEGVGNHDGDPDKPVRLGVKARNPMRPGVREISPDGLHYSWDWDQIHFVLLNLFPGSAGDDIVNPWGQKFQGNWKYPQHSLEFLADDLARHVGSSGRPVVLLQHYGWDDLGKGWWSDQERAAFYEAIRKYNVAAIFWGHSHSSQFISWNGIPTWCVGAGQKDPEAGEFFVVHITPTEMTVAERQPRGWGLTASIPLKGR